MTLNFLSLQRKMFTRIAQVGFRNISISHPLRKNFYETLGVPRDASQADIKNAYFELSKMYHPDRIAATDENLAKFREISAAYEILGNEQSRKLYDRGLLGEFKRPGADEEEEIQDPIIKFYKQRRELSKTIAKAEDEGDAWTKTYYKKERSKFIKKEQIYKLAKQDDHVKENLNQELLLIYASFIIMFFFLSNFENTKPHKLWTSIFG